MMKQVFAMMALALGLVLRPAYADFNLLLRDVISGGTDTQVGNCNEADTIIALDAPNATYNFTDTEVTRTVIDVAGGGGNFGTNDPLPDGTTGTGKEDYILNATAYVRIPAGDWSIGFGSDDGGRLRVDGITFLTENNTNGDSASGDNEVYFNGTRGHGWTWGTFTLATQLETTFDALMFERGGGDSFEVAIYAGHAGSAPASWVLLQDGAEGWTVSADPLIDTNPPSITVLSPADDATGVNPAANLVTTFDENIVLTGSGTVSIVNLDASTRQDITLPDPQVTVSGMDLTIDPAEDLGFGTNYAVRISNHAVADLWNPPNTFPGITNDTTWNFTIAAPDDTAPVITNTVPADDATGVIPDANLVAMFDEGIVVGSGNIVVYNVTDATNLTTIAVTNASQVSIAGNVLTIDPDVLLDGAKEFAVQIDAGAVQNYSGVPFGGLAGTSNWSFTVTSETTYSGETGNYNQDTWNNAANWDHGIPGGQLEAIIGEGEYVSVTKDKSGVDTPAYTGDLTLRTNATLEIGQNSAATDLNALGGGSITFHTGSMLKLRYSTTSTHSQNFVMLGDATFAIGTSSSAHHDNRTLTGVISGTGKLTVHSSNGQRLTLAATNTWSGGLVMGGAESENKNESLQATSTGAFGSGDVTIDDGVGLLIDAPDAIADSATLSLSGGDGEENFKLTLNADDTVSHAYLDGNPLQGGTYGRIGVGTVDYEMGWIGGDSVLTVSNAPADSTPPTVLIDSPPAATPIYGMPSITYTVTFDEYIDEATLRATHFTSAGTAPYSLGIVTNTTSYPYPTVLTVEVIPSGVGTVQLQISGTIKDLAGNALAVPVNDDRIYVLERAEFPRQEITVDGTNSTFSTGSPVSLTFDASGSDKLVVVITGEHGFPNNAGGNCSGITYDGVALTRAVDRNPITNPDSTVDQTYNDIWYLDDPGSVHTAGSIVATVSTRGSMTAFALSNTATGVAATAISPQDSKSVSLLTAGENSIVIASHGMGGYGNTADPQNVDTVPPLIEASALRTSTRGWCGHVTGYMMVESPSLATPTFTGGNVSGAHTIAAEFQAALIPPPDGLLIIVR